jgi:hypothetical protein
MNPGSTPVPTVPKEKRTKLEPSRRKGMFVGYGESSKAYHIYIPGQQHIEVSRDVSFEEEVSFKILDDLTWRLIVRSKGRWCLIPLTLK